MVIHTVFDKLLIRKRKSIHYIYSDYATMASLKKLFVEERWKRYSQARSIAQARAASRFKSHKRAKNAQRLGKERPRPKKFKHTISIAAPENFSAIRNPDETIAFLNKVRSTRQFANVFVDLSAVKTITPDAIAALLATIHRSDSKAHTSGNVPEDARIRDILDASGFYQYLVRQKREAGKRPLGAIRKKQISRDNVKFNQFIALELIGFATKHFRGVQGNHQPTYSVFGEAMLNTVYHATPPGEPRPEPWWASVYCDSDRKRACFTFVDQGVGIFKSHKLGLTLNVATQLKLLSHADILKELMLGNIPSSSKVRGRGNGIPGMYRHCKAGRIREITILANDAIGNGETDTYNQIKTPFSGTILYWEVEL